MALPNPQKYQNGAGGSWLVVCTSHEPPATNPIQLFKLLAHASVRATLITDTSCGVVGLTVPH